jgi:hypothetical protein
MGLPRQQQQWKKHHHQLSLSQLNLILLLLPPSSPSPKSKPLLYKAGVEEACLTRLAPTGGTGNCTLILATTSLLAAERNPAERRDVTGGRAGKGRRECRATESIVKPREAIT